MDYFCICEENVLCKLVIDYLASRLYINSTVKCKTDSTNEFEASCSWLENQQLLLLKKETAVPRDCF